MAVKLSLHEHDDLTLINTELFYLVVALGGLDPDILEHWNLEDW